MLLLWYIHFISYTSAHLYYYIICSSTVYLCYVYSTYKQPFYMYNTISFL